MEHWNEEQLEELLDGAFAADMACLEKREKEQTDKHASDENMHTMTDIYNEIYDEFGRDNKQCKMILNEMFQALFGCDYKEVLVKGSKEYKIGENGKALLKFLIKIRSIRDGRNIKDRKYKEIDFLNENYLLYYVTEFLKEREMQEGEKERTADELCREIMKRFDIENGTLELRKAVAQFNMWMETLANDDELVPIHEEMAKKIDEFAKRMYEGI